MSILPVGVPQVALYEIARVFLGNNRPENRRIELIIRIADNDINVRELSAYLSLADRVYGRLTPEGLRSYAQSRKDQLVIKEVRKGSIELVIEQAIAHSQNAPYFIIAALFLRHFSAILRAGSDSMKTLAEAHKLYQEGEVIKESRKYASLRSGAEIAKIEAETGKTLEEIRTSKENRRIIRQQIKQDKALENLDDKRKRQLAILLEDIYAHEGRQLPAAERFVQMKVLSVDIVVDDQQEKFE